MMTTTIIFYFTIALFLLLFVIVILNKKCSELKLEIARLYPFKAISTGLELELTLCKKTLSQQPNSVLVIRDCIVRDTKTTRHRFKTGQLIDCYFYTDKHIVGVGKGGATYIVSKDDIITK